MMKKITRIAALLATTALLLAGFPACGDDDGDEDPTLTGISIKTENAITEYTVGEAFDKTGIKVMANYSDGKEIDVTNEAGTTITAESEGTDISALTEGSHDVKITATYGGKEKSEDLTITVTVKDDSSANDDGTDDGNGDKEDNSDGEDDGDNSGNGEGEGPGSGNGEGDKTEEDKGTTYAWTFADLRDVTIEGVVNATKDGWPTTETDLAAATVNATTFAATADGHNGYKDNNKDIVQFALKSDVSYPSTGKKGLTMKVKSVAGGVPVNYNAWSDKTASSNNTAIKDTASAGYIDGEKEFLEIAEVQGPFKVEVIYCGNASSDKTDRYAFVKIGDEVTKDSAYQTSAPAVGSTLTKVYNGNDKVTVYIGGRKNDNTAGGFVRIHDVKITPLTAVVAVESVTVNGDVHELTVGEKTTLTAAVSPENATDKTVTWSITGEDGESATEAATITDGKVTAKSVTADTVVKIFVTAGGKTSEAYSITIKADTTPKLPTVTLFSFKDASAKLTDVTIENADDDYVTISNVSFNLENDTNNIGWSKDNPPAVGTVNSAVSKAAGTDNTIGYTGKTAEADNASESQNEGSPVATVKFTVTPKEGSSVTLTGLDGYLRYASTSNYKGMVTIGSHTYTSEVADGTSKVVTISDSITDINATSEAFDVTIQFVSSKKNGANVKPKQQFDVFNIKLTFAEE